MSGIDIPIRKFERVPRSVFESIKREVEQRKLMHRNKEMEKKVALAKKIEENNIIDEVFINGEVAAIMRNLENEFNIHKKNLIGKAHSGETFYFGYISPKLHFRCELWEIVAQRSKSAIEAVVTIDNWRSKFREVECSVRLVDLI